MNLIQDLYIVFFNHIFKYTSKINEDVRDWIARICIFFLVSTFFVRMILTEQGITDLVAADLNRMGSALLLVLCVISVKKPLKRIKWNKWIVYPYFAAAIYMTLTSIHHFTGKGYQAYALQLLLLFPALYFVYANNKDYDRYFRWMSKSAVWLGIATIIATFVFAPPNGDNIVGGRYLGLTGNPNILAMLMLIVSTGSLYRMSLRNRFAILYAILSGICAGIIWISGARTGIIAISLQIIASLVIVIRIDISKNKDKIGRFVLCIFTVIMISTVLSVATFNIRGNIVDNSTVAIHLFPVSYAVIEEQETVIMADNNSTEKRFITEGKSIDEFSSGRITLWKWYLDKMNIVGHDCSNHQIQMGNGVTLHNAHNTFLEIPYRFGIPAGIFYALFILTIIVALIKGALIKGNKRYVIFIVLASLAYVIEAMLDVMTLPFERGPVLIFCMALVGVFEGDILKSKEDVEWNGNRMPYLE